MEAKQWHARLRNYAEEKPSDAKQSSDQHPLKSTGKPALNQSLAAQPSEKPAKKNEPVVLDPLSRMAQENVDFDPLGIMTKTSVEAGPTKIRSGSDSAKQQQVASAKKAPVVTPADELWATKRTQVLSTYTTREKIAIRTAVLSAKDNIQQVVIQTEKLKPTDRVEQRLAELNDFDETTKTECVSVTVEEYLAKIADVNSMLTAAWRDEQRVKAVRLAIQCAKMLNDTSVIEFYPSKFVLITDILDNFGNLVFDRLRTKAESVGRALPDDFTSIDVPNAAKETTLNWFYKLASIRELLPRIYMQAAILQSLRFISDKSLDEWLAELTMMTRGIANPLVALYTSAYLCRVGLRAYFIKNKQGGSKSQNISSTSSGTTFSAAAGSCLPPYLRNCIDDFLLISRQLNRLSFDRLPKDDSITLASYVRLFIPALEWIFQCIASFASNSNAAAHLATEILKAADGHPNYDLIVHCLLSIFPPSFIVETASTIAQAVNDMKRPDIPKWQLFRTLGLALLSSEPLFSERKRIFELGWQNSMVSSDTNSPRDILQSSEVWLEYSVRYLDLSDSDVVLGSIVETCAKLGQNLETYTPVLQSTLSKFIQHVKDFEKLMGLSNFVKFLDCFGSKGAPRADACRLVVEAYQKTPHSTIGDQVFIDSLMFLCKTWHDSAVSYHSSPDVARQMARSVNSFINRVDYGRDFEKLLQFYMECRSTFVYLEDVIVHLIMMVNRAVMMVRGVVKGQHTKRTLNFAKASIAFCYITVPSIDDLFKQLRLSILTAQTALVNGCIGQAEALFRLAITTLTEVPVSMLGTDGRQHPTDSLFAETVGQLCAALIPLPDSPEQAALYIWQGLVNATLRYDWQASSAVPGSSMSVSPITSTSPKLDAFLSILQAFAALSQPKYIYTVESVDANDVLYGGDVRFIARLSELATEITNAIVTDLEERASTALVPKKATALALSSHQNLVAFVASSLLPVLEIGNADSIRLANRLWELGGTNNPRMLKLKILLVGEKANVAEQLFPS